MSEVFHENLCLSASTLKAAPYEPSRLGRRVGLCGAACAFPDEARARDTGATHALCHYRIPIGILSWITDTKILFDDSQWSFAPTHLPVIVYTASANDAAE